MNNEFWKRLVKYSLEGLAVAVAVVVIPQRSLDVKEVYAVALTAAATFAVLDLLAPSIAVGARKGAGFGIGLNVSGNNVSGLFGNDQPAGVPVPVPAPAPQTASPAGSGV
jgi:hypothetical protein